MNLLSLRTYPDPCLRIRTKPVEKFDRSLERALREMADIMYASRGIGLAATQVGLGLSVLVVDTGEGLMAFVNPEILERSKNRTAMEEGCLSVPGVIVNVSRPEKVKVRARDAKGGIFVKSFDGLAAKAVQHEMDHLAGRLIIDHLDPVRRFFAKRKLRRTKTRQGIETCEVVCSVGKKDQ